jgi:hypothetical protein
MFLIPTFFGPALGEWSLRQSEPLFFGLAAAPMLFAVATTWSMPRAREPAPPPETASYFLLIQDNRLWGANAADAVSGAGYGFAAGFLPLLLVERGIPVAGFFIPFAVTLLFVRFFGLRRLQRLAAPLLAGIGVGAVIIGLGPTSRHCFLARSLTLPSGRKYLKI